ncbi:MAG: hypothetical protein HC849_24030 [Oscillatoriales cyanobacterium RU_3_3]|nr:hypothetical protein [Microcoleus sp. SU_5_6]NJM62571.1 hypothetical protein [Oscillatoriales cyanobacterium RU_3_3]NJR25611.1 hypothetical protein [Richelia sp. CSU_2_1]
MSSRKKCPSSIVPAGRSGTQGTNDRVRIFNESRSSAQGLVAHHPDFPPVFAGCELR